MKGWAGAMTRLARTIGVHGFCGGLAVLAAVPAYWILGWLGVGMLGTLIAFVGFRLELEEDGPVIGANTQYSELYTELFRRRQTMTSAERAEKWAETRALRRVANALKWVGLVLLAIGGYGFCFYQIPQ
ncbi:hypothetical protein [Labrys neptuniae]